MTSWQKVIKYLAMALAILLCVSIIGGILGALGTISYIFDGKSSAAGETKTYDISENITALDIKIGAADFSVKTGADFRVESNLKKITVDEKNGRLVISEKGNKFGINYRSGELWVVLYVPDGTVFEKADITTGAGTVSMESLSSDSLTLEFGAGKVNIGELTAKNVADIELGAGQVVVSGGALNRLDLEMGVGELKLTSALSGDCDIACGIGSAEFVILGNADDYRINIQKGIGETRLNGESFSGVYGNGLNKIDISGGIGKIEVNFKQK